jgi:4-carboxymuconolactone decarboxylase
MTESTRALVSLSAALTSGDQASLVAAVDRAALECSALAAEEVLIQSYLFLGYPATLNALAVWRQRTGRSAAETTADDWEYWVHRGETLCGRVYGSQYERLRGNVAALHPDLDRWMVAEGYGKVLARPGLEMEVRELCIVALLAGIDAPRQLHSHLRGALNVGAKAAEVGEALEIALANAPPARRSVAERIWSEVQVRGGAGPEVQQRGGAG